MTCTISDSCKNCARLLNDDRHIDCVVAEMGLALDGGRNLLTVMRGSVRLRQVPVLVTTINPDQEKVVRAVEQGAAGILLLPCPVEQMLAKVIETIENGRPRILVVDDDEMIRDLLCNLLEIERYTVTTAASAAEALEKLKIESPRAVVADMLMPEMSGMELLKRIKAEQPTLPVLIITGYAGHYSAADLRASGADGFLTKPFKNTELMRVLKLAIRQAQSAPVPAPVH
jgi:DNA-binding NtrC family response regulator